MKNTHHVPRRLSRFERGAAKSVTNAELLALLSEPQQLAELRAQIATMATTRLRELRAKAGEAPMALTPALALRPRRAQEL